MSRYVKICDNANNCKLDIILECNKIPFTNRMICYKNKINKLR